MSIRSSSTVTKRSIATLACLFGVLFSATAQQIRGHYVSKAEEDGVIYHTLPVTLFTHSRAGDLTFDITYKEHRDGLATVNFTCFSQQTALVDSVRFAAGRTLLAAPVEKLYLEPDGKGWKHRYTFRVPVSLIGAFFDETADPAVDLFVGGAALRYRAKRSAWRSYAPVGYRIFEMIRVNEQ